MCQARRGGPRPGHRQEQLTQTLIVLPLKKHLFLLFQKLGGAGAFLVTPLLIQHIFISHRMTRVTMKRIVSAVTLLDPRHQVTVHFWRTRLMLKPSCHTKDHLPSKSLRMPMSLPQGNPL